jgi:hypothetical protein
MKAEQLSSTKLYSLQHEVIKDISKLDSRMSEIEINNVKDQTLTINQLQSVDQRLNIMTENIQSTKQEELLKSDKSILRYEELNDIFRMTLEAHVNERLEEIKAEMKTMVREEKDTNLGDHFSQLVQANEMMKIQFHDLSSKMLPMINDYESKIKSLENQIVVSSVSLTNLQNELIDSRRELQELREQSAAKTDQLLQEQLNVNNAPTGALTLTNSNTSLYFPIGASSEKGMIGGDASHPPATRIMIGQSSNSQ